MTSSQNPPLLRLIDECLVGGDWRVVKELVTDDHALHCPALGPLEGVEGVRKALLYLRRGLSDWQLVSHRLIEEGRTAGIRFVAQARHSEAIGRIAPTNRVIEIRGIGLASLRGSKLASTWFEGSGVSFLRQLGAFELVDPVIDEEV